MERYISGFGLSLIIMLIFNALLVIVKESVDPLMNAMKAVTGHHWTTHGIVVMALFLILGFIFSGLQPEGKPWLGAKSVTKWTIIATIIGYLLIVCFYLFIG